MAGGLRQKGHAKSGFTPIGGAARVRQPLAVVEVLVFIHRPAALGDAEMRVWLMSCARDYAPELTVAEVNDSDCQVGLVRFEVHAQSPEDARAQLSELMMDMRLVGLRPAFAAGIPRTHAHEHNHRPALSPADLEPDAAGRTIGAGPEPPTKIGRSTDGGPIYGPLD
jgi:hypothetical protein